METKTSKCVKCDFKKVYEGRFGTTYYFNVAFENGDKGSIGFQDKNKPRFKVGDSVTYEIGKDDKGYDVIKLKGDFGGGKREFDEYGQRVGAAMHDACAIVAGMMVADSKLPSEADIVSEIETYARHCYAISEKLKAEFKGEKPPTEHPVTQHIRDIMGKHPRLVHAMNEQIHKEKAKGFCERLYATADGQEAAFIAAMSNELGVE